MRCPQPDWIEHRLTVTGPAAGLAAFRAAARGSGVVPWVLDYDAMEEDLLHRLLAPPPERRGISAAGARILARRLRDLAWQDHEEAVAQYGHARGCPFDLQALAPVPWPILQLGPDHPDAIAWLFAHWGTTWPLRRVEVLGVHPSESAVQRDSGADPALRLGFWAADWSPWPVLAACRARWPTLRFELALEYWWEEERPLARRRRAS